MHSAVVETPGLAKLFKEKYIYIYVPAFWLLNLIFLFYLPPVSLLQKNQDLWSTANSATRHARTTSYTTTFDAK